MAQHEAAETAQRQVDFVALSPDEQARIAAKRAANQKSLERTGTVLGALVVMALVGALVYGALKPQSSSEDSTSPLSGDTNTTSTSTAGVADVTSITVHGHSISVGTTADEVFGVLTKDDWAAEPDVEDVALGLRTTHHYSVGDQSFDMIFERKAKDGPYFLIHIVIRDSGSNAPGVIVDRAGVDRIIEPVLFGTHDLSTIDPTGDSGEALAQVDAAIKDFSDAALALDPAPAGLPGDLAIKARTDLVDLAAALIAWRHCVEGNGPSGCAQLLDLMFEKMGRVGDDGHELLRYSSRTLDQWRQKDPGIIPDQ